MKKLITVLLICALTIGLVGCNSEHSYGKLEPFNPSVGIDENGYWKGLTALNQIDIFTYTGVEVPREDHEVTDETVKDSIDDFLQRMHMEYGYPLPVEKLTNKKLKIKDEDRVNIDYVGSIDKEEFEGGNSFGEGMDVTAGSEDFIDDFLTQIIGASPGDTLNVEVTFPEDYGDPETNPERAELNGKEAVFKVTINYIHGEPRELYDEFMMEHFSESHGWSTVDEIWDFAHNMLYENKIVEFIERYLIDQVPEEKIPASLIKRIEKNMAEEINSRAMAEEMSLSEYVEEVIEADGGIEAVIERERDKIIETAQLELALQAVMEDMEMSVTDQEVDDHLSRQGVQDIAAEIEERGMPFLKNRLMQDKVFEHITENLNKL